MRIPDSGDCRTVAAPVGFAVALFPPSSASVQAILHQSHDSTSPGKLWHVRPAPPALRGASTGRGAQLPSASPAPQIISWLICFMKSQ